MKTKPSNFISIDVGSSKIAAIAAHIEHNGKINIVGQSLYYSEGIKSGTVIDFKKAENSIVNAIYNLEKECRKSIKCVTISLSGTSAKSYYAHTKTKTINQYVTKSDVVKLISKSLDNFNILNQEVIHYFPIEFILDDNSSILDPIGMYGTDLCARVHLVAANSSMLLNLINCLTQCQVEVEEVVLSIYAAGLACLTEDEKNLGVLVIDIGAQNTSFGIFMNGKLLYTGGIPIGGWHITSDIAKILSLNIVTAEKIKILYGNAIISMVDKDSIIDLEAFDTELNSAINSRTTISISELAAIIQPRAEEIINLVKIEYDKIGIDYLIARCIVLTGSGATLRGIQELTHRIFDKYVRVGKPHILPGFIEDYNPSAYSTAIGIVKHHANKQGKLYINHKNAGKMKLGWLEQVISWLKDNI